MRSVKIYTAPVGEPVTVEQVKLAARVDYVDDDAMIAQWITTARELAEAFHGRAYLNQTIDLSFDRFPCTPLDLPRPPLVSVTSVTVTDINGVTTDVTSSFEVDNNSEPGRIAFKWGYHWPAIILKEIGGVKIRYVAGYGTSASNTVPQFVKDAIILWCSWKNDNRTAEVEAPAAFYSLLRQDRCFCK
jgi:uncharacterized phiE125 gp8 family phage protein